jgi:hypothetical protein
MYSYGLAEEHKSLTSLPRMKRPISESYPFFNEVAFNKALTGGELSPAAVEMVYHCGIRIIYADFLRFVSR